MGMGVFQQKEPKGKIGAAISGARITGGHFMDTTLFLNCTKWPLQGSLKFLTF